MQLEPYHLEPYHPGKLTQSRRKADLVAARVTALGALTVAALAVGSAMARLARLRAPEVDELARRRVDAPEGDRPTARHVYRMTEQALRRVDAITTHGPRRTSVSVWMAEWWISRAGE
jgi:hypothetical protein